MNIKTIILIVAISVLIAFNNSHAKKNKILFKVNNEIITTLDLLDETLYLKAINAELQSTEEKVIYEIAKKSLIRHKVKKIELKNKLKSYDLDENVLKELILNHFRKFGINTKIELDKFFLDKKINHEYVKSRIQTDILWNEFIYVKFKNRVKIDEEKIKDELLTKKKENEFLLSEILFNLSSNENLSQKLKLIRDTINKKGFSEAALSFSISSSSENGGKLDWIRETSLNKKIRDQINTIEIGNYTDPIVIPGGFLILKLENKRSKNIDIDFDIAVKQITRKKVNEQLNQFSTIHYNKILKDIKINEF